MLGLIIVSCEKDDEHVEGLENLEAPSALGVTFQITQDNTGLVTIIPTGQGANLFQIDFGDGSEVSEEVRVGEKIQHVYDEGQYEVVVTGKNLAGETAEAIEPLTVSFRQPENLEVDIVRDPEDNYRVSVSAEADYAAMYHVYFGEVTDEEPVLLMPGESVTYTYSDVGTYPVKVVALSGGAATTEKVTEVLISDPLFLPLDFESTTKDYAFINFGGGEGAGVPIVANPEPDEVNPSDRVAAYTKTAGSETWAGTTIALDEPIDFSEERFIQVDVWSPEAGTDVVFKVENLANPDIAVEFTAETTLSEQWETLTFDLNAIDPSQEYGRLALFFNMGVSGTGETYYFDNIRTTKMEQIKLPLSFEHPIETYDWIGFGGAVGAVIPNPYETGDNPSAHVTELLKPVGAQTWAGISHDLDEVIDFTTGTTARMQVWSPAAGIPILLKLEDSQSAPNAEGNPSVFVEVSANTTTPGQWEELVFDLEAIPGFDEAAAYDRVIVFYDFGAEGSGSSFLFDNVRLTQPGDGAVELLGFESGDFTWTGFGNATGAVVENPIVAGINQSSRVTELNKPEGAQTWAGISYDLAEPIDFSAGTKVNMKVLSPEAGVPILFKLEDSGSAPNAEGNPSVFVEVTGKTTTSGAWEEMIFDLASSADFDPSNNYDRVIVFYDFGSLGEGSNFYFDEIQLTN